MAAFEMTPQGMVALGDADNDVDPYVVIDAGEALRSFATPPAPLKAVSGVSDPSLTQNIKFTGITPKTVISAAKARVREIKAELRNHKALQTELYQLESLLQAAKKLPKTATKTH